MRRAVTGASRRSGSRFSGAFPDEFSAQLSGLRSPLSENCAGPEFDRVVPRVTVYGITAAPTLPFAHRRVPTAMLLNGENS